MKTAITQKIDGFQVIIIFGVALIDPVASAKANKIIYFNPSENEFILEKEKFVELYSKFKNLEENELLTLDGEIVINNIDKVYWTKVKNSWIENKITNLNIAIPLEGIEAENLIEEQKKEISDQIESKRIENLSQEEKIKEYESNFNMLLSQAVFERSKLEIQGIDSSISLTQTQEWLQIQTTQLKLKYSIP